MIINKKKIKKVFKEQLEVINPSKEELNFLNEKTEEIKEILNKNLKKNKIKAEVFVGGSFAKNTIIKKEKYDIDIFVRFDEKYQDEEISSLLKKIITVKSEKLHGSRDYFKLKINENLEFEIIPTLKVQKAEEAKNITDLSFFHVSYVSKELKKRKALENEIKLAKSFVHASGCYGAESYINGFSGYALELLVIYYKSLMKFIEAIVKIKDEDEKLIIDKERLFKNKDKILIEMNEAKLNSPIIVVDPTFKERNAIASLSHDTFNRFKLSCKSFLKNPSEKFFEIKNKEEEFNKKISKAKSKGEKIILELKTNKQAGDIAGTKLKKFFGFFTQTRSDLSRFFDIYAKEFVYDEKLNIGKMLLVVKAKKQIIFGGPPIEMKEQLKRFKLEHKNIEVIKGKAQAIEKGYMNLSEFLDDFKLKNEKLIEEMDVSEMKLM